MHGSRVFCSNETPIWVRFSRVAAPAPSSRGGGAAAPLGGAACPSAALPCRRRRCPAGSGGRRGLPGRRRKHGGRGRGGRGLAGPARRGARCSPLPARWAGAARAGWGAGLTGVAAAPGSAVGHSPERPCRSARPLRCTAVAVGASSWKPDACSGGIKARLLMSRLSTYNCVRPLGPALLFVKTSQGKEEGRRFYACSACRDRKDCNFFQWEDEKVRERCLRLW